MLKNIWAIMCENIIQDKTTNKESYIFAIENGEFSEFPAEMPQFCLATFWQRLVDDEIRYKLRISLIFENGEKVDDIIETPEFPFKKQRNHFNLMNLSGYHIPEPGEYKVHVEFSANNSEWTSGAFVPVSFTKKQQKDSSYQIHK